MIKGTNHLTPMVIITGNGTANMNMKKSSLLSAKKLRRPLLIGIMRSTYTNIPQLLLLCGK
jgi:hypothetical protein